MSLANLKVFSDTMELVSTEMIAQQYDLFNAATQGAITLRQSKNRGDYASTLKYQKISGLIRERDITSAAAVASLDLVRILEGSVKVARGIGPINLVPSEYDWIMRDAGEAGAVIGMQVAGDKMADMLNTGIAAFVAATLNVGSTLVNDTSATLALTALADGAQKLGDASKNIVCWVMHSYCWNGLYKAGLAGTNMLFNFGNVAIAKDPLGRPIVITDSTDMINSSDYYTLGLVPGGIVVEDNGDTRIATETTTGYQNITTRYQGQYTYNLGLKGYKWDESTGGQCPADAALASGGNWDKTATSVKDMAGVIVTAH